MLRIVVEEVEQVLAKEGENVQVGVLPLLGG